MTTELDALLADLAEAYGLDLLDAPGNINARQLAGSGWTLRVLANVCYLENTRPEHEEKDPVDALDYSDVRALYEVWTAIREVQASW